MVTDGARRLAHKRRSKHWCSKQVFAARSAELHKERRAFMAPQVSPIFLHPNFPPVNPSPPSYRRSISPSEILLKKSRQIIFLPGARGTTERTVPHAQYRTRLACKLSQCKGTELVLGRLITFRATGFASPRRYGVASGSFCITPSLGQGEDPPMRPNPPSKEAPLRRGRSFQAKRHRRRLLDGRGEYRGTGFLYNLGKCIWCVYLNFCIQLHYDK